MSNNLVIVALPRLEEEVNKVSSEKAAHVTLLFLGDEANVTPEIVQYVEHAVATSFQPIYLDVSERGTLGPDQADVLFFEGHGARELEAFRSLLLKDPNIKALYDAQDQYPKFTPHLTLGYPDAPAGETDRVYALQSIEVDRIAVWTEDSDGPEFKPPYKELMWSDKDTKITEPALIQADTLVADILEHAGVKGMKWGVRKAEKAAGDAQATPSITPKGKAAIKTSKGGSRPATDDAIKAAKLKQTYQKSGPNALTNKQLQDLQTRMNLEKNVSTLAAKPDNKIQAFMKKKMGFTVNRVADTAITQQVDRAVKGNNKK